jgi:hypothetical protein
MSDEMVKVAPIAATDLLETAKQTLADRGTQRDCATTGERSMASTVRAFNALTGLNLTEENGWEFMVLLKMVRGRQGATRADDYVDLASYGALLGECKLKKN